eukprot:GILJ01004561.1.p1 GENE.GILJ01004561.1~~GILJ01004561.1.p1  ORF type:complete len:844 (+),score=42.54 GILJ01004561.1:290-2533(+)
MEHGDCVCLSGYTGEYCERTICVHGLLHVDADDIPSCLCEPGYFGFMCDQTTPVHAQPVTRERLEVVVVGPVENFDQSAFKSSVADLVSVRASRIYINMTSSVDAGHTRVIFDILPHKGHKQQKQNHVTITPSMAVATLRQRFTAGDASLKVLGLHSLKYGDFPLQTSSLSDSYDSMWNEVQYVLDRVPSGKAVCSSTYFCQHGGSFNLTSCSCMCTEKWAGQFCESCIASVNCDRGHFNITSCECDCQVPFYGPTCSLCKPPVCQHGSIFDPDVCGCGCTAPWIGQACDQCNPSFDCIHGDLDLNTCTCSCEPHWKGFPCTKCELQDLVVPCLNGGKLDNETCTCECTNFYAGAQCEQFDIQKGCRLQCTSYQGFDPQCYRKCHMTYAPPKMVDCVDGPPPNFATPGTLGIGGVSIAIAKSEAVRNNTKYFGVMAISPSVGFLFLYGETPRSVPVRSRTGCQFPCMDEPTMACGCFGSYCLTGENTKRMIIYQLDDGEENSPQPSFKEVEEPVSSITAIMAAAPKTPLPIQSPVSPSHADTNDVTPPTAAEATTSTTTTGQEKPLTTADGRQQRDTPTFPRFLETQNQHESNVLDSRESHSSPHRLGDRFARGSQSHSRRPVEHEDELDRPYPSRHGGSRQALHEYTYDRRPRRASIPSELSAYRFRSRTEPEQASVHRPVGSRRISVGYDDEDLYDDEDGIRRRSVAPGSRGARGADGRYPVTRRRPSGGSSYRQAPHNRQYVAY